MNRTSSCIAPLKTKNTRSSVVFASFALIGLVLIASIALSISSVQANWTRGSFLNQEFRNQQPSTGNILYSLFGDGTPGATPYTRLWTVYQPRCKLCLPTFTEETFQTILFLCSILGPIRSLCRWLWVDVVPWLVLDLLRLEVHFLLILHLVLDQILL